MLSEETKIAITNMSPPDRTPRQRLAEIRAYMDRHYEEPITVAALAEMAQLSINYFIELFKKTYGQSALDYLTGLRIHRAKRYLLETDKRMRDIAVLVGYSDEYYFSRKFKKEVGMTPTEYAKKGRRRVAAYSSAAIGHLLALDVMPEAAPLDPKWTSYYYNEYRTLVKSHLKLTHPYTSGTFEENRDKLTQLWPDAIIGTDRLHAAEKAQLAAIAPSCFLPMNQIGWKEQLRTAARFLSRGEAAERWIERYERKVRSAREQAAEAVGCDTVIVLRIFGSNLYLYWNQGLHDVLLEDLQLRLFCGGPSNNEPLAMEQLTELDPDRIMVVVCAEATSRTHWLMLQHTEAWRRLKAVAGGRVYPILPDPWFEYSPVAVNRMLDEAVLLFTGKCPNGHPHNIHGDVYPHDL